MRIVREQMLCIISPAPPGASDAMRRHEPALCAALLSTRVVHFAAFALLPARPGAAEGTPPSLLFELAVDEGLRPADTIVALVQAAFLPLWRIYGGLWPGGDDDERPAWLRGYLLRHTSIADGGFVGARDRGVAQIQDEHALLGATIAAANHVGQEQRARSDTYACAVAGDVLAQARFDWARQLWPSSFWRGKAGTPAGKLRWLVTLVLAAALALWLVGGIAGWLSGHLPYGPWRLLSVVKRICAVLLAQLPWLGGFLLVLLAVFIVAKIAMFLLPPLRRVWPAVEDELGRADARPMASLYESLVTFVALAATLALVGAWVVHAAASVDPTFAAVFAPAAQWVRASAEALWQQRLLLIAIAVLTAIAIGMTAARGHVVPATFATRAAAGYQRIGLWRPHEVKRSQTIHASIEAREAELAQAGRVAHMISLVDIRWPVPLFRFSLRLWLRVITAFGRIVYTEGRLGDAPGIHFGHWHIVDEGRRLLFCSNFDGKWGGYLDDFINGAAIGLNAIWRCTELRPRPAARPGEPAVTHWRAFPPTRLGLWRGVKCEQWFKAYARDSMVPYAFRFEAYRLSLQHIERATALRQALAGTRSVANDDRIMRIIES